LRQLIYMSTTTIAVYYYEPKRNCRLCIALRACDTDRQEGLTVASIARDVVVVRRPLPATTMRGKFGLEFET